MGCSDRDPQQNALKKLESLGGSFEQGNTGALRLEIPDDINVDDLREIVSNLQDVRKVEIVRSKREVIRMTAGSPEALYEMRAIIEKEFPNAKIEVAVNAF